MIDRDDLKAFVDGELSPLQMSEIREAVDKDPQLAREVAEIANLTHTIRAAAHVHQAIGLDETLAALKRARSPWRSLAVPIAAVGVCGIIFAIIFPVFGQAKAAAKRTAVAMEMSKSGSLASPMSDEQYGAKSLDAPPHTPPVRADGLGTESVHQDQSVAKRMASATKSGVTAPSFGKTTFRAPVPKTGVADGRVYAIVRVRWSNATTELRTLKPVRCPT